MSPSRTIFEINGDFYQ